MKEDIEKLAEKKRLLINTAVDIITSFKLTGTIVINIGFIISSSMISIGVGLKYDIQLALIIFGCFGLILTLINYNIIHEELRKNGN